MTPEDQYPSTSDCARKIRKGEDPVALCLLNAMERVKTSHSTSMYSSTDRWTGKVLEACAVGAVYVEGGVTDAGDYAPIGKGLYEEIESRLRDEAKEAIRLLNEAAVEVCPEAIGYGYWQGPLEWVNQEWFPEDNVAQARDREDWMAYALNWQDQVKAKVLEIYRQALHNRMAAVAA